MTETRRAARDSRKLATREALREAALRLALERGPDNVPEADIAAAAGVPAARLPELLLQRRAGHCSG